MQRMEYHQRPVVAGMASQILRLEMQGNPQPDKIAVMRNTAESAFKDIAGISPGSLCLAANGLAPR